MSDDDLWRPRQPDPDDEPAGEGGEQGNQPEDTGDATPNLDETQPITGSSSAAGSSAETPATQQPRTPPGPSYEAPSGPGAVPPPTNPYGQIPGGQAPGGPGPYGQAPGGQGPYGQPPYGGQPGPYGQAPGGQDPYGQQPYGGPQNPYAPPPNPYPQPNEYGAPQYPYGVPYQPAYAGMLPDHPSATTSMVLGIIGLAGIIFCGGITLVLAPFAWAMGAKSVREIDEQPGRYAGRDKAQAGKWMGIIGTVLLVLGVLLLALVLVVGVSISNNQPNHVGHGPTTFQRG